MSRLTSTFIGGSPVSIVDERSDWRDNRHFACTLQYSHTMGYCGSARQYWWSSLEDSHHYVIRPSAVHATTFSLLRTFLDEVFLLSILPVCTNSIISQVVVITSRVSTTLEMVHQCMFHHAQTAHYSFSRWLRARCSQAGSTLDAEELADQ